MSISDLFRPPSGVGAIASEGRDSGDFGDVALTTPLVTSSDIQTTLTFPETLSDPAYALKTLRIEIYDAVDIYSNCTGAISQWIKDHTTQSESSESSESGQTNNENYKIEGEIKKSKIAYVINLPLPNALQEQNAHSYSEEGDLFGNIAKMTNNLSTSVSSAANTLNRFTGFTDVAKDLRAFTPQLPLVDPMKWQNYTGSSLRTFQFVFKLVPRSVEEANNMFRIVYILKRASYPVQNVGGNVLIPPSRIRLIFKNPVLQKLINPGMCVIDSVGSVYETGDDVATTLDGVPRKLELTLSFKEFRQKYADDWDIDGNVEG